MGDRHPDVSRGLAGARTRALVEVLAASESPAMTARRARRRERSGADQDPIVWREAVGANVIDVEGNVFVDLTAGFGVAALGHRPPSVVAAVHEELDRLVHALGDVHPSDVKIELLERLARITPIADARVILGAHGSDAIETALKSAFLASGRPGVLAFEGAYHGLHQGALPLAGYSAAFRAPFAPWSSMPVSFVPYPRASESTDEVLASIARVLEEPRPTDAAIGAIVVEPMLGRGGTRFGPPGWLLGLRRLARAHDVVLVVDEIWTGLGRTGAWLASAEAGLVGEDAPDIVCLGKALGGGFPISAAVMREDIARAWGDPRGEALYTGTFHGAPPACAAALASLDALEELEVATRAREVGGRWLARLTSELAGLPFVREVRGLGLALGIELDDGARTLRVVRRLLERGYITLPSGMRAETLQLAPPLTIDEALLARFDEVLCEVLRDAGETS